MSNLLSSADGIAALQIAQSFQIQRRMSRFFKDTLRIDYHKWLNGNGFDLETFLGQLNAAHDQEILNLFSLLGTVGSLPVSLSDTTIHVNALTGSDTTGDGSAARPFASLAFVSLLPRVINHKYIIAIESDMTLSQGLVIDTTFGPNGELAIVGVGVPTVLAGPFEVAASAALAGDTGRAIQMTTPFSTDPSGHFMLCVTGTNAGKAYPIHTQIAADTVILNMDPAISTIAGETWSVVRPAVNITAPFVVIAAKNQRSFSPLSHVGARVIIANTRLSLTMGWENALGVDSSCSVQLTFVEAIALAANATFGFHSDVNDQTGSDDIRIASGSNVVNLVDVSGTPRPCGLSLYGSGINFNGTIEKIAKWVSAKNFVTLNAVADLLHCAAGAFTAARLNGRIRNSFAFGRTLGTGRGGALDVTNSIIDIDGFVALTSENVCTLEANSRLTVENFGVDATYSTVSGYGAYFLGTGVIELRDDGAFFAGTLNAIHFEVTAAPSSAAIPAAWGVVTVELSSLKRFGV